MVAGLQVGGAHAAALCALPLVLPLLLEFGGGVEEGSVLGHAGAGERRGPGEKGQRGRRRVFQQASPAPCAASQNARGVERFVSTSTRRVSEGFLGPYPAKTGLPNAFQVF
jgi:hypothetical protein